MRPPPILNTNPTIQKKTTIPPNHLKNPMKSLPLLFIYTHLYLASFYNNYSYYTYYYIMIFKYCKCRRSFFPYPKTILIKNTMIPITSKVCMSFPPSLNRNPNTQKKIIIPANDFNASILILSFPIISHFQFGKYVFYGVIKH